MLIEGKLQSNAKLCEKEQALGKNGRKGETMDTERQKNCLLPVPRAAVIYDRQLKSSVYPLNLHYEEVEQSLSLVSPKDIFLAKFEAI